MKKRLITLIAAMLALPVFAALQMVDISTLTTNTVIHVVSPGILFTNTIATNVWLNYSTEDTNALQIGDTPYQAFTKVNANFTLLAPLTNAITSLLPTNALVPSVSGNTGFIPTNSGTGGSGTTNFTLTGFVQNWTTNNELSLSGTNTVNLLITNLAIANQGGFGTNTTLISGVSVTTTNLAVIGQTWLNNSNISVYLIGTTNGLIPNMIEINQPSGLATDSSHGVGNEAWRAFGGGTWASIAKTNPVTEWIQYQFQTSKTIDHYSGAFGISSNGVVSLQGSLDGVSWTNLSTFDTPMGGIIIGYTNCIQFTGAYFRWLITSTNISGGYDAFELQLYNTNMLNVISNSFTLEILSTNGMTINTNSSGGFALNILGGVNVSDNYYINGIPINGNPNSGGGSIYSQLLVTNGTGTATQYNGIYTKETGIPLWTNNANTCTLFGAGSYSLGFGSIVNLSYNIFVTNAYTALASVSIPVYTSDTLLSQYTPYGASPSPGLIVSAYFTNAPSAVLNYRAGITNIPTLTTSQAVLFSTPFSPTVGTNYCVNVSFDTALAAAVGFSTTSKTTNGFTVTLSGTITGAVQVDYAAWPYQ